MWESFFSKISIAIYGLLSGFSSNISAVFRIDFVKFEAENVVKYNCSLPNWLFLNILDFSTTFYTFYELKAEIRTQHFEKKTNTVNYN